MTTDSCMRCTVRETSICHSLSMDRLAELSRIGHRHTVERGATLQWEGEEAVLVGNVVAGVLKLSASTRDGKDQTLGIAYAGDFIGRPFGGRSHQSVTALTDAQVCTFSRSAFDRFARGNPELEHGLLGRTLADLDQARRWMLVLGTRDAGQRLSAFLLESADRFVGEHCTPAGAPQRFDLPFGRQEVAEVLGLSIETVSRQISRLREAGVIDTAGRRGIVILDRAALTACAGET